jgi:hypothetical protein
MFLVRRTEGAAEPWDTGRAMLYGAAIGFVAAIFKLLAPWGVVHARRAIVMELAGAMLAFALLCGIAAALRNLLAKRLAEPDRSPLQ